MRTSPEGRAFIEAFEGKCLHAYDDETGVMTIGYGHTSAAGSPLVYRGQVITNQECDDILSDDLRLVEKIVENCITSPMTQCQFDALVSFDFNTGDLRKSSIPEKINEGNIAAAMATLLEYDHGGGRQMAGLTRRRKAERLMFLGRVTEALSMAHAHIASKPGPLPKAKKSTVPEQPPSITKPEPGSIGAFIAKLFSSILSSFKRK